MSAIRSRLLFAFVTAALLCPASMVAELRIGRAKVDISPGKGMPMGGQYYVRLNEGVHDPLFAKAIVLEQDGVKAALVACDLVGIGREMVLEARELISKQTGIPGANVMISATHTHTGPEMGSRLRGIDEKTLKIATNYLSSLPKLIAQSVVAAEKDLQPAKLSAGIGQEDSVAFIRRFWMQDGTVGWNPGKKNPKIVRPTGTIDPSLPVVLFESPDNQALAMYVNYANHLDTTGGLKYSKDYPHALAETLRAAMGDQMLTVFTIGTAGNVNHVDVESERPQKGYGEAARIGGILAGEALRTLRKMETITPGALKVSSTIVPLELPALEKDRAWAEEVVARYGTDKAAPFYEQVYAFKVLDVLGREGKPHDAEVQVISLGDDIAWVGLPGEVFVELGKAIKIASPFRYTIISELANGRIGYIPDHKAYPQGAYEAISTRVARGGGEKLVKAATDLLIQHRGEVPSRSR